MANNHRIDKIQKSAYCLDRIPCGMNSIIYLDTKPASSRFIEDVVKKKKQNEIILISHWSDKTARFEVVNTIL
jgi:hypothetical protein